MKSFKTYIIENSEKVSGLHVFDVDGVVFHPHAEVHVKDKTGKRVASLSHHEYNTHKLKPGHSYDYTEFRNADIFQKGKPIHNIIRKIKSIQRNNGKVVFNSARSDLNDKDTVLDKFEQHGIDMSKSHFYRSGNIPGNHSVGEKKNIVLHKLIQKHSPSHIHFYDDDRQNLAAFNRMSKQHPNIKFHAWHVQSDGSTRKFQSEK